MVSSAAPALLSIMMIAVFALAAGGSWMLVKRRDAKKGVPMAMAALVILANIVIWTAPSS